MAINGLFSTPLIMSALPPKADKPHNSELMIIANITLDFSNKL